MIEALPKETVNYFLLAMCMRNILSFKCDSLVRMVCCTGAIQYGIKLKLTSSSAVDGLDTTLLPLVFDLFFLCCPFDMFFLIVMIVISL